LKPATGDLSRAIAARQLEADRDHVDTDGEIGGKRPSWSCGRTAQQCWPNRRRLTKRARPAFDGLGRTRTWTSDQRCLPLAAHRSAPSWAASQSGPAACSGSSSGLTVSTRPAWGPSPSTASRWLAGGCRSSAASTRSSARALPRWRSWCRWRRDGTWRGKVGGVPGADAGQPGPFPLAGPPVGRPGLLRDVVLTAYNHALAW